MIVGISSWWPLQGVSLQRESTLRLLPFVGFPRDGVANLCQRAPVGTPRSGRQKTCPRVKVQVVARPMDLLSGSAMREVHAYVCLVGCLVGREANVAIDSQKRSAMRLRVGDDPGTDRFQAESHVEDQAQAWLTNRFFVAAFVLQEPLPTVVALDLLEELEQLRGEIRFSHESP